MKSCYCYSWAELSSALPFVPLRAAMLSVPLLAAAWLEPTLVESNRP